jgi:hypothetical protein
MIIKQFQLEIAQCICFFLIIMVPIFILTIEPFLYLSETMLLIPDDYAQTRVIEKYDHIKSEITLLSFTVIPLAMPVTKLLKDRKFRSLGIQITDHYKIDFEKFFPMMWMSFIVALCGVFVYNFRTFH